MENRQKICECQGCKTNIKGPPLIEERGFLRLWDVAVKYNSYQAMRVMLMLIQGRHSDETVQRWGVKIPEELDRR